MVESSGEPTAAPAKPNIVEELVNAGTMAFNPKSSPQDQERGRQRYDTVIETYAYTSIFKIIIF